MIRPHASLLGLNQSLASGDRSYSRGRLWRLMCTRFHEGILELQLCLAINEMTLVRPKEYTRPTMVYSSRTREKCSVCL